LGIEEHENDSELNEILERACLGDIDLFDKASKLSGGQI
jgi:hypothetical protein